MIITTLDFTLLSVAVTIYAKAGGTPWVLERQLIPAGVFIGIAFMRPKVVSSNGQTKEIFYYGVLTVYSKFGKYIDMTVHEIRMTINRGLRIQGTRVFTYLGMTWFKR